MSRDLVGGIASSPFDGGRADNGSNRGDEFDAAGVAAGGEYSQVLPFDDVDHIDADVREMVRELPRPPSDLDVVRDREGGRSESERGRGTTTSETIPSIRRPGGSHRRSVLVTTLLLSRVDRVASFVTAKCTGISSPDLPILNGSAGGVAPKTRTVRSNGSCFYLDDDTSDIVDDCGVTGTISRSHHQNDRRFFLSSLLASSLLGATPANAAKGAAEYDLEYYMRDLL